MDDQFTYNNLGIKAKRFTFANSDGENFKNLSLKDIGPKDQHECNKLFYAFTNDLEKILKYEKLDQLAQSLLDTQIRLEILNDHLPDWPKDMEFPNLDGLYKLVAPLLLRAIADEKDPLKASSAQTEAIRVAIEEEIYQWRSKAQDKQDKANWPL